MVVLSAITETKPSSSGTRGRRRYAFSGSPPTAIVGVARFTASPARRARSSSQKGAGPGSSSRHASVSTTAASA